MALLKVENLTYNYPDAEKPSLNEINIEIRQGEFILLVGSSGSGKSSLIRVLAGLAPEFYGGKISGEVTIDGESLLNMNRREISRTIGVVFQDPESQLVMNSVEEELAFGLENIGVPNCLIKRRIMEVKSALNLSGFVNQSIPELSGGQKQKTAFGSVLAMQPDILILDEPTSQLDPIAGEDILTMIRRLNEENGITVILTEQRLERCFHLADRIIVMDQGRIVKDHSSKEGVARWAIENKIGFLPPVVRLFAKINSPEIPVTVKEGRRIIENYYLDHMNRLEKDDLVLVDENRINENHIINIKNLWFTYENGKEVLRNIDMTIREGECTVIMGENGGGKTTLLKLIRNLLKPSRGKIQVCGLDIKKSTIEDMTEKVGYLSQNPNDYLFLPTVEEELRFTMENFNQVDENTITEILKRLDIEHYRKTNPRDLSTGERQRVALASVLVNKPQLLLLDEPTRGLDYDLKEKLGRLILDLKSEGTTVVIVAHDVEFAAEYGDRVLLMDGGIIVADGPKEHILSDSTFYSPQIGKLFHKFHKQVVTQEHAEKLLINKQEIKIG